MNTGEMPSFGPDNEWLEHFGEVTKNAFDGIGRDNEHKLSATDHLVLAEMDALADRQIDLSSDARDELERILQLTIGQSPEMIDAITGKARKIIENYEKGTGENRRYMYEACKRYLELYESGKIKNKEDLS